MHGPARSFTAKLVQRLYTALGRGDIPAASAEALGLAVKTMSNYTNSIAGTPLDGAVEKLRWKKPKIAMRTGS